MDDNTISYFYEFSKFLMRVVTYRMLKTAIYGYGIFGKRTSQSFHNCWDGEYVVTAIYDRVPENKFDDIWGLAVRHPDRMEEDYQNGLFDKVFVALFYPDVRDSVIEELHARGLETFFPGREEDLAGPECFDLVEDPGLKIDEEGYQFHVYRNILGTPAEYNRTGIVFLYNESGKLIRLDWEKYLDNDRDKPLMYPIRLKDPTVERIPMKGSWCVLARNFVENYWHFTFENADCVFLLEEAGYKGNYLVDNRSFITEILRLLGVTPDRIFYTDQLELQKAYVFEELVSLMYIAERMKSSTPVLKRMSAKIRKTLVRDPKYPKKLYVKRIGMRKLLNGEETAVRRGYEVFVPDGKSVQEQMNYFYNADIILCPHGANSTNCIYMHKGAVFAEIFSDRWYMNINAVICRANGIIHQKLIGKSLPGKYDLYTDYVVSEKEYEKFIDRVEKLATPVGRLKWKGMAFWGK